MSFRILFFLMFFTIVGYGQTNYIKKTADEFYKKERYLEAIDFYEKLVLTKKADAESLKKLATAYLRIRQTDKAEAIWNELIVSGEKSEEVFFQYAYSLASNGNYEQAKIYFQKVLTLNPVNKRALKFYDGYCNLSNYYADTSNYKFYYTLFNSTHSEFSPILYNDKLVFVSSRTNPLGVQRVFEYNNTPFLDLYVVDTSSIQKKLVKGLIFEEDEDLKQKNKIAIETSSDTKSSVYLSPTLDSDSLKGNDKKYGVKLFSKDLSSSYHEGPSVFSEEDQVLYFTGNNFKTKTKRGVIKPLSIHSALSNGKGGYKKATELSFANSKYSIAHPALSDDGTILYFSSDMLGGAGGMDLYKAIKTGKEWSTPVNLTALNTPGDEVFPYIFNDELLFFASNGNGGLGGLDLFYTRIDDFSVVKNTGSPINSSKDDFGICIYENAKRGYVSSNRIKRGEDDDIYYFESNNKFEIEKVKAYGDIKVAFKGILKDKKDSSAIKTMIAVFYQTEDNLVELKNSDNSGAFSFYLHDNATYIVKIADSDYYIITDSVITKNIKSDSNKIYYLEKNRAVANIDSVQKKLKEQVSKITFYGKVFDADDKEPLESIVKITNPNNSMLDDITISDTDGSFSFLMSTPGNYTFDILCEEYKMYTTTIELPDSAVIHKSFKVSKLNSSYDSLKNIWVPIGGIPVFMKDSISKAPISKVDSVLAVNKKIANEKTTFFGSVETFEGKEPMLSLVAFYEKAGGEPLFVLASDENGFFSCQLERSKVYMVEILEVGYLPYQEFLTIDDTALIRREVFRIKKPIKEEVYKEINARISEQVSHIDENDKLIEEKTAYSNVIKGFVFEQKDYIPIAARVILLNSENGKIIKDTITSIKGAFQFYVTEKVPFKILVEAEGFHSETFFSRGSTFNKSQLILFLTKIPFFKK